MIMFYVKQESLFIENNPRPGAIKYHFVEIDNIATEILFDVLPDVYLRIDILVGCEFLNKGFCINIAATKFTVTRD